MPNARRASGAGKGEARESHAAPEREAVTFSVARHPRPSVGAAVAFAGAGSRAEPGMRQGQTSPHNSHRLSAMMIAATAQAAIRSAGPLT